MQAHPQSLAHQASVAALVELRLVESENDAVDRPPALLRRQRRDQRRVHAAGKKDTYRHVALQPLLHRVANERLHMVEHLVLVLVGFARVREAPIRRDGAGAGVGVKDDRVRGWQLPQAVKHAEWRRHRLVHEVRVERVRVDWRRGRQQGEQGVHRRSELERAPFVQVVKRLLARPVTGAEKRAQILVPHGQAKHAVEAIEQSFESPLAVAVEDHLTIST